MEEQEAVRKNLEWEQEKREKEIEKQAKERERREMLHKKREREKEEFFLRLKESEKKFADAQNNLEQVQRNQMEKKVSFDNIVSTKVVAICQGRKL